jgi:hypothetical protein
MERRYKVLRFIATMMKVVGILTGILAILGAISICGIFTSSGLAFEQILRNFGQDTRGFGAFAGILGGLFAGILPIILGASLALIMYAGGEAVNLQIDIEENTRSTVWYLQNQHRSSTPSQTIYQPAQQHQPPARSHPPPVRDEDIEESDTAEEVSDSEKLQRIFCPQCGNRIDQEEEQCSNCGYTLG